MSIQPLDVNRDGQPDVLVSDRYGPRAGIAWYENPGKDNATWPRHDVCKMDVQALFLTPATLEADRTDVLIASSKAILWYKLDGELRETIPLPDWCGTGKAVSVGDLDGDQQPDFVFTCENAVGERSGNRLGEAQPHGLAVPRHRRPGRDQVRSLPVGRSGQRRRSRRDHDRRTRRPARRAGRGVV